MAEENSYTVKLVQDYALKMFYERLERISSEKFNYEGELTMSPRKDANVPCTLEEHKKYIEDENRSMNKYTSTTNPRNDLRWEKQKNNQTPHIK